MKIALITENSQAAKNCIIHEALTAVAEPLGHQVFNYGMYTAEDTASLTYVRNGHLTCILHDLKAASCHDMLTVLKSVDQDLLKAAIAGEKFAEHFYANAQDQEIAAYLREL